MSLGEELRRVRVANGMRQSDAAAILDVSGVTVAQWESGVVPKRDNKLLSLESFLRQYDIGDRDFAQEIIDQLLVWMRETDRDYDLVGELLGVTGGAVRHWLAGRCRPSYSNLIKLQGIMGVPMHDCLYLRDILMRAAEFVSGRLVELIGSGDVGQLYVQLLTDRIFVAGDQRGRSVEVHGVFLDGKLIGYLADGKNVVTGGKELDELSYGYVKELLVGGMQT